MPKRKRRVTLFGIGGDAWQRDYGKHFSAAMGGRKIGGKRKRSGRRRRPRR